MSLLSGERQVAPTVAGIRGDHLARYRFAAERLGEHQAVLDAGCGIGYGARLLAERGHAVYAWDHDPEAIGYGRTHYEHAQIRWSIVDVCAAKCGQASAAVAFEVLEHLERPGLALIRFPNVLIASVPNAEKRPDNYYGPDAFITLLMGAGYDVRELWSQTDLTDAPLQRGGGGRTLVALCVR